MTSGGKNPVSLDDGIKRIFIQDGASMALHGHAKGEGYRIGFGASEETILPVR